MPAFDVSSVVSRVVNNPSDPYGAPLVRYVLRVRDRSTGRWWYVKTISKPIGEERRYTFTSDPTGARMMSFRTACRHQTCMVSGNQIF